MPRFVGQGVQVFKPGMTFETQVSVKHSDQVTFNFKDQNNEFMVNVNINQDQDQDQDQDQGKY